MFSARQTTTLAKLAALAVEAGQEPPHVIEMDAAGNLLLSDLTIIRADR